MQHQIQEQNNIEYSRKREMAEVYASLALKNFGLALLTIFEVLYIFEFFDNNIASTLLFYAITFFGYALVAPFGAKFISRVGIKHAILIANPFFVAYFFFLFSLPDHAWMIFLAGAVVIVYRAIFWTAFHIDVCRFTSEKKRGRQINIMQIIPLLANAVGPLIGGLLISNFGFSFLFIVVMFLLVGSALPLFFSKEIHDHYDFNWRQSYKYLFQKKHWKRILAFSADGIDAKTISVIWPIFLFLAVDSYVEVGAITSGVFVILVLFSLYIGRVSDSSKRSTLLKIGSVLHSLGYIARAFVQTGWQVFSVDAFDRAAKRMVYLPFTTLLYDNAQKRGNQADEYIVAYEIAHNIFGSIFLLAMVYVSFVTDVFMVAFFVTAATSLLYNFMPKAGFFTFLKKD
ncbi:MAG: MFS transporter [bacterium]